MKLQPGMIYKTRNGANALIFMVEGTRRGGIHGAVSLDEKFELAKYGDLLGWEVSLWKPDGKHYKSRNFDLELSIKPVPCREWLNQVAATIMALPASVELGAKVFPGEYGSESDPSTGKEPF